jgi:hypothetical protein
VTDAVKASTKASVASEKRPSHSFSLPWLTAVS